MVNNIWTIYDADGKPQSRNDGRYGGTVAVFDLDNTLIDSKAKLKADFVGAMHRLGITMSPEETMFGNWYEVAERYGFSKEVFDEAFGHRKTWEESLEAGEVPIFPETRECLERLAGNGVRMGLLSKSIPKYTDAKLRYFDLGKYFQAVETVHPREPNKIDGAHKVIEQLNPDNISEAFFIGDKEEDVTVARDIEDWHTPFYGELEQRHFDCRGIYVSRRGEKLENYLSVTNLHEVNDYILKDGR